MTDVAVAPTADQAAETSAPSTRYCTDCGYDLRGLQQNRCPECGLEFDPHLLPTANIPWLTREGNPLVAYYRTVWLVLARPRRFGDMVWQDVEVDPLETTRFRWITIGIACGSILATMLPAVTPLSMPAIGLLVGIAVPMIFFFWLATEKFERFSAAKYAQEMRFRRLHDLTCAGLALSPLVPMFLLLGLILRLSVLYVELGVLGLTMVIGFAWWYGPVRYQIHGGRCGATDAVLHALLLPFAWGLIAVVIFIFSIGIVGVAAQMIDF